MALGQGPPVTPDKVGRAFAYLLVALFSLIVAAGGVWLLDRIIDSIRGGC